MKSLDEKIKKYYTDKRLSEAQLKRITQSGKFKNSRKQSLLKYSAAASIVMLLCYVFFVHPIVTENKIVRSYAKEIRYNHSKQSPMKIMTDDAEFLTSSLPKLNFNVSYGKRLETFGKLVGGKYCHVDDQIAAQLRIIDKADNPLTCYQFKQRHKINFDKIINIEGVDVHLWNQDSIVFAVAQTTEVYIE